MTSLIGDSAILHHVYRNNSKYVTHQAVRGLFVLKFNVHPCDKSPLISHSFVVCLAKTKKLHFYWVLTDLSKWRNPNSEQRAPVKLVNFIYWSRLRAKNRNCFDPKADDNDFSLTTHLTRRQTYTTENAEKFDEICSRSCCCFFSGSHSFGSTWSLRWKQNNKIRKPFSQVRENGQMESERERFPSGFKHFHSTGCGFGTEHWTHISAMSWTDILTRYNDLESNRTSEKFEWSFLDIDLDGLETRGRRIRLSFFSDSRERKSAQTMVIL